ncbi:hypothetical protein BGZ76_008448, partial [Entomortierella beljakovae]
MPQHRMILTSGAARRVQAGGPSTLLGALKGAHIWVKEETEPKDELNIEMITRE